MYLSENVEFYSVIYRSLCCDLISSCYFCSKFWSSGECI